MALKAPRRPSAPIEEAMGFVGFFGIAFLAVTVFCEFTGRPALGWALTLLACVLVIVVLDRWRVRVVRRTEAAEAEAAGRPVRRDAHPVGVHVPGGEQPVATVFRDHAHSGWDDPEPRRPRPVAVTGVGHGSRDVGDVTHATDG
ncbi:hypothetical protein EDF24_3674 [Curtobacterium sp. PhB130]|uniref:hypothetical protein n=1 Tax=Curtobacterium sp. PhB130 TaxID=2485178 RepID=UPI000FC2D341|nr:hypothetical protein [Curtobacterium sp. PhB130]ROS72027.1 hypothetical protein EDF24_3674 [Curtobacterium sp. PhB130]